MKSLKKSSLRAKRSNLTAFEIAMAGFASLAMTMTQAVVAGFSLRNIKERRLKPAATVATATSVLYLLLTAFYPLFAKGRDVTPSSLWEYGAGARSLGMARAFTAVVNDASASYWNPAALAEIPKQEIIALHSPLETGASYDYLGYAYPMSSQGGIGISVVRTGISGIEKHNIDNSAPVSLFSYSKFGLILAYGRRYGPKLMAGSALKTTSRNLPGSSSHLTGLDLALSYRLKPYTRLAVNAQNVFGLSQNTDDKLTPNLKTGFSHGFLQDTLKLAIEFESLPGTLHAGAEYTFKGLTLRAGIDTNETAIGVGYCWKNITFDYALGLRELGSAQRMGIRYSFGKNILEERRAAVKDVVANAIQAYRKGSYLKARYEIQQAMANNPDNQRVQNMDKKLLQITQILNLTKHEFNWETWTTNDAGNHKAELVKNGLACYLDNDNEKAALYLEQALAFDPKDEQIRTLFVNAAKLAGRNDLLSKPAMKPDINIAKRLAEAEEDFWAERYELAVKKCEEVIILEPDNVVAHTRLGSLYFALGMKEKAIQEWEHALKLKPDDPMLIDILKKVDKTLP